MERVSLHDPDVHETHPQHGARLDNTTGQHLAAGPISVFDEGSYAGDARLGDAPPGDILLEQCVGSSGGILRL